jgi:hypothetical protein
MLALLASAPFGWLVRTLVEALGKICDVRALARLVALANATPGIGELPWAIKNLLAKHAKSATDELLRDLLRLRDAHHYIGCDVLADALACYDDAKDLAEAELRRRGVNDDPLFEYERRSRRWPFWRE